MRFVPELDYWNSWNSCVVERGEYIFFQMVKRFEVIESSQGTHPAIKRGRAGMIGNRPTSVEPIRKFLTPMACCTLKIKIK